MPREGTGLTKWNVREICAKAETTWTDLAKSHRNIHPVWKFLQASGEKGHLFKQGSSEGMASWGSVKYDETSSHTPP